MCYSVNISKTVAQIENYFKSTFGGSFPFVPPQEISGFSQPMLPVLSIENPNEIAMAQWGFKEDWLPSPILNARSEEAKDKKTFNTILENRCLLPVDGFYEWKWLDSKGKKKQKHFIQHPDKETFSLAGIYRIHEVEETKEKLLQFVILTTDAKGIMEEVHNTKHRMPIAFFKLENGLEFLDGKKVEGDHDFIALGDPMEDNQMKLF